MSTRLAPRTNTCVWVRNRVKGGTARGRSRPEGGPTHIDVADDDETL